MDRITKDLAKEKVSGKTHYFESSGTWTHDLPTRGEHVNNCTKDAVSSFVKIDGYDYQDNVSYKREVSVTVV
jgi:hypothetical protein